MRELGVVFALVLALVFGAASARGSTDEILGEWTFDSAASGIEPEHRTEFEFMLQMTGMAQFRFAPKYTNLGGRKARTQYQRDDDDVIAVWMERLPPMFQYDEPETLLFRVTGGNTLVLLGMRQARTPADKRWYWRRSATRGARPQQRSAPSPPPHQIVIGHDPSEPARPPSAEGPGSAASGAGLAEQHEQFKSDLAEGLSRPEVAEQRAALERELAAAVSNSQAAEQRAALERELAAALQRGPSASAPEDDSAPASTGLAGCWDWSNGATVAIAEGGTVRAGALKGTWSRQGDGSHSIRWPDPVERVTLAPGGSTLRGTNNFGQPVQATRVGAAGDGITGRWQWGNGALVEIDSDGEVVSGPIRGRWVSNGHGAGYTVEWRLPVVDTVLISDDGRSLRAQNSFGSFSATRGEDCDD